jgi:hypothetical protein
MSQDNQTSIPEAPQASRRALLFGIAAVGAVASPAVAASLLATPKATCPAVDPIFALLAEHRAAWDRYDEAHAVHSELRETADEEGLYDLSKIHLYDFPDQEVETLVNTKHEFHIRFVPTSKLIPVFASHLHEIKRDAPKWLTKSQRAYWIRKKKRELKLAEEARMELINNSECGRAYDVWSAADTVLRDITARLVGSRPTSIAGAAAVLKHIAEFAVGHDEQFDSDDEAVQFMASIADSLGDMVARGQA